MARRPNGNGHRQVAPFVQAIEVEGFKSIAKRQRMEIRPLTVLAGANSSGKSSMMQPTLLIKQTLENQFDSGALWIGGPNVRMTEFDQLFWRTGERAKTFTIGFESSSGCCQLEFASVGGTLELKRQTIARGTTKFELSDHMSPLQLRRLQAIVKAKEPVHVVPDRAFFVVDVGNYSPAIALHLAPEPIEFVRQMIHVPGLRPSASERGERMFPKATVADSFAGAFDYYFASVLNDWQRRRSPELDHVGQDLQELGLTWKVEVEEISDVALSIRVGRLPRKPARGGDRDLVNMADVGFGVSQALPVVVALRAAKPGDTVFIEQPELHLHPRAQVAMATILADSAKRGVRVIAETHSSLLLLGIQTLAAQGKLDSGLVKLHWFQRDKEGATTVTPADLDKSGAFGNWPEDFDDVALEADKRYLDAVEHQAARK